MTPPRRVAVGLLAALLASGCTSGTAGSPPRTATGTTSATSSVTRGETPRPTVAPPVGRTLDLGRFREHPCDLLTSEQQSALSLPRTVDRFDMCGWEKARPKDSVTVQLLVNLSYLTQVYLESNKENVELARKEWVIFEPVTVSGQPAVVLNPTTNQAYSSVLVAASPTDSIYVSVTIEAGGADPRTRATAVAEQIVGNLGG